MKNRTRTIIELVIVIVVALWVAIMFQWQIRHPDRHLGYAAERLG